MRVKILYFAQLREDRGLPEETLEIEDGLRAQDVLERLISRTPSVRALRGSLSIAVNGMIARRDVVLSDGDEVAVLPPVSGG